MMKFLTASAAALLVAGCGALSGQAPPPNDGDFTLWSPAFADGAALERRHAGNLRTNPNCVGENVSPPLAWRNPPPGTKSLAIVVHDQAGFNGLGVAHWVAYGIDPKVTGFAENEAGKSPVKWVAGKNSLNQDLYLGPCPAPRTGLHAYVFTLIATDLEPGALPAGLTMPQLLERFKGHAKGASAIVLRYRPN